MCPPMSAEAREKQELKWFDPLMKEEKKWTPTEINTLKKAVKEAMIAHQMQPYCSRRFDCKKEFYFIKKFIKNKN